MGNVFVLSRIEDTRFQKDQLQKRSEAITTLQSGWMVGIELYETVILREQDNRLNDITNVIEWQTRLNKKGLCNNAIAILLHNDEEARNPDRMELSKMREASSD